MEGDHSFTVDISDFGGANAGATTSATATILDDDGKYIILLCFYT